MADSKVEETREPSDKKSDGKHEEGEAPSPPQKRRMGKTAILAGVIVAQIIVSYFLQRVFLFRTPPSAEAHGVEIEESTEKKTDKHAEAPMKEGEIVLLDEIIVNPAETGGRRFLAVTIGFQVIGMGEHGISDQYKPLIRDGLIGLLSGKAISQLADIAYRDTLREEIRQKIEEEIRPHEVSRVFFTGYVLQ